MALTLQIKRSTGSTAPGTLADGELAYTHGNDKLFIGDGSTVKVLGGKIGKFIQVAYSNLLMTRLTIQTEHSLQVRRF